ncbi:DivIVA domain-containing protein, partial [Frankia sp. CcWB2]
MDPGAATERPAFDEVAYGYDPHQVDDYLATLWRYASQVTSRAAAAESALKNERVRSANMGVEGLAAQAGGRIGQMLTIAQQEAEEIVTGARQIAEAALEEVIEDAGANHPIVREAREQAEKLLLDAVEESRRLARERHAELQAEIARCTASLEALRHQQGEIIGAMLRLRGVLASDEVDRAVTDLARAGTAAPTTPGTPGTPGTSGSAGTSVVDGPTMPPASPVGVPPDLSYGRQPGGSSPFGPGRAGPAGFPAGGAGPSDLSGLSGTAWATGRVASTGRRSPGRHRQADVADAE